MRRAECERGQITLLVIGFAVILVALVAVVVDASQVVLLRRTLSSLADGAALTAAQSLSEPSLYAGQATASLPLDRAAAHAAVVGYLQGSGLDVTLLRVEVVGDRVTVAVASRADLPLVGSVTSAFQGTTVVATASARSPIR
jgi:uncharacterized membrane protein